MGFLLFFSLLLPWGFFLFALLLPWVSSCLLSFLPWVSSCLLSFSLGFLLVCSSSPLVLFLFLSLGFSSWVFASSSPHIVITVSGRSYTSSHTSSLVVCCVRPFWCRGDLVSRPECKPYPAQGHYFTRSPNKLRLWVSAGRLQLFSVVPGWTVEGNLRSAAVRNECM